MKEQQTSGVTIWDLPTRIFHWLLVTSFIITWITFDDNRFLFAHVYAGYVFFSLLVFRFIWGLFGTKYAKFRAFAYDWHSVSDYAKGLLNGNAMRYLGHNPAGGWAIFLMLALGLIISISGLMVLGGEEGHGPLAGLVSFEIGSEYAHEIHEILAWVMLAVTCIHVIGVIVESLFHKDNLIWAMITGKKPHVDSSEGVRAHKILGLTIVTLVFISALLSFRGYLIETADDLYQPFKGPNLPDNASWRSECGDCHIEFHPTLLPARSWKAIFDNQHEHFEDDLDLDEETLSELQKFHLEFSAESGLTEPAHKINRSIPTEKIIIRITETDYWKEKHDEIDKKYWKSEKVSSKANCGACHLDAKKGTYEDSAMRLPKLN